jgi:long-chain acyl-CoA synthetase
MWNFDVFSNSIAIIDSKDRFWTYKELNEKVLSFQKLIRDEKSLIFILTQNKVDLLFSYIFAMQFGHVPLLINGDIDPILLTDLVTLYEPNYIISSEENDYNFSNYTKLDNISDNITILKIDSFTKHNIHPSLALLLSTSGSTGNPKLIRLTMANIESNMKVISSYLKLSNQDRAITTLPMNYTYGLSIINSHLYAGASIILTDFSIVDNQFWQLFNKYQPTSLNGVPYTYQLLKRLLKPNHLSSLRYMTQAGGRLGSSLQQHFANLTKDNNIDFFVMYGQTEATARMAYLSPSRVLDKIESIGQTIPGGRFELVSEDGTLITSPHVLGELIYYGPNVALGYAQSLEDLSLGDQWSGRLATGDLAIIDEEGFYFIQGRKNRYVKVYGVRINLDDVEKEVIRFVGSQEIAIVGIEDRINIYSVMPLDSNISNTVAKRFAIHPSVFTNNVISEIPKNKSGKTLYTNLVESKQG